MIAEVLVLRLVHVVGGIFWVGSGLFTTFFLTPALAESGAAAGAIMAALQRRRLFTLLPIVALLTIFSGIRLLWIASAGFSASYFASVQGRIFGWSGVAAIIAFLLSLILVRPAAVKAGVLGSTLGSMPDGEARMRATRELDRLRRRMSAGSVAGTVLLLLAAAGMAVARYVR